MSVSVEEIVRRWVLRKVEKYPFFQSCVALSGGKDGGSLLQVFRGAMPVSEWRPCSSCGFLASSETCSFCARVRKIRAFLGRD